MQIIPKYIFAILDELQRVVSYDLKLEDPIIIFQRIRDKYPALTNVNLFHIWAWHNNKTLDQLDLQTKQILLIKLKNIAPHYYPDPFELHKTFLNQAHYYAKNSENEIPIGAVVTLNNQIISYGSNQTIQNLDITAHAEIVAIKNASKILGTHRLSQCYLYTTVEPCIMCSGAILHSRIKKLIYGSYEKKTGVISNNLKIFDKAHNPHCEVIPIINQDLYMKEVQQFFKNKRS